VNRTELRQLAEDRIADAVALLAAGRWSGAYYVTGYAVECGLKACIAKLTNQDDFPPDRRFVEECYTHSLDKLINASGLKAGLDAEMARDVAFFQNWSVAKSWQESSRYEQRSEVQARELYAAVADDNNGVLQWVRRYW
jgi:HEPN domain-containing protein